MGLNNESFGSWFFFFWFYAKVSEQPDQVALKLDFGLWDTTWTTNNGVKHKGEGLDD